MWEFFCRYPFALLDSFFKLWQSGRAVSIEGHPVPVGMLEHVQSVHVVGVVGDAQEFPLLKAGDAALFFNFAQCGEGNLFTPFLFPFGKVPKSVAQDKEVFSFIVLYESSSGIYWGEGTAKVGEGLFKIVGINGNVQILQIFVLLK